MSVKKDEKQATSLQKSSSQEQVKTYFQRVFELKQIGKEFPVSFDDVWPLVYQRKDYAVKELLKNFVENDDYQAFRQKAERTGTHPTKYMLSVPCLEFFIAKKVKPIFEVYRQVFHKAIEGNLSSSKQLESEVGYNEDQVFVTRLGNGTIKGYYAKGVLYFALNHILVNLGYTVKGGGTYAKRYSGSILVTRGKQQTWFVSLGWIDELLKHSSLSIAAEKVNIIYKELYKSDKRIGKEIIYRYRYTGDQMLDLLTLVNRIGKPGLKAEILNKLMEGSL